jgi:hypothetical protein
MMRSMLTKRRAVVTPWSRIGMINTVVDVQKIDGKRIG